MGWPVLMSVSPCERIPRLSEPAAHSSAPRIAVPEALQRRNIWSVVVDGELYVRAYNGTRSRWYQAAMQQGSGRITAAGMTKEVSLEPVEGALHDRIDDAYREKYRDSRYLEPMISPRSRAATVKVVSRGGG